MNELESKNYKEVAPTPYQGFFDELKRLERHAGAVALSGLREFANGEITLDEYQQEVENTPDFEQFQTAAMELLELYGALEMSDDGTPIVDIDTLFDLSPKLFSVHANKRGKQGLDVIHGKEATSIFATDEELDIARDKMRTIVTEYDVHRGTNKRTFLYNAFHGTLVYSKSQFDNSKISGDQQAIKKPLFYDPPKNSDDAFNIEQIKQAQFHIAPWEIPAVGTDEEDAYSDFHPDVSFTEIMLATQIYHPQYGDGKRNNLGVLEVTSLVGERQPITQQWLREEKLSGAFTKDSLLLELVQGSPKEILENGYFSELTHHGLLEPTDFRKHIDRGEDVGINFERIISNKKGMVTLDNGMRYTLGKNYGSSTHKVVKMSTELYGIILKEGDSETLVAVLDSLSPQDTGVRLVSNNTGSDYYSVSQTVLKRKNALRPLDTDHPNIFLPRKENESDIDYEKRKEEVFTFRDVFEVRNLIYKKTNISIDTLSPEQQHNIAKVYSTVQMSNRETEFFDFIKTYSSEGLQVLTFFSDIPDEVHKVLDVMNAGKTRADIIAFIRKVASIAEDVQHISDTIEHIVGSEVLENIKAGTFARISVKTAQIIREFTAKGSTDVSYREIDDMYTRLRSDILIFGATCKTLLSSRGNNVDTVRELLESKMDVVAAKDLSEQDVATMRQMFKQNRTHLSENVAEQMTKKEFDMHIQNPFNSIHTLKHEGEIVSYGIFKPVDDHTLYAGLFNTEDVLRGDGIGMVFAREVIKEVGRHKNIVMKVRIDNPAITAYKDVLNFTPNSSLYTDPDTDLVYIDMIRYADSSVTTASAA